MLGSVASGPPCCPTLPRRRAYPGELPQAPEMQVDERRKPAPSGMAVPSHLPLTTSGTDLKVWQTWKQLPAARISSEVAHRG